MKKTISNLFFSSISQFLTLVVPFVTTPYVARILGPSNLGIYSYMYSVSLIFMNIGLIGLNSYGTREIAYNQDNKHERSRVFFEITTIRFILMIVSFIIFYSMYMNTKYHVYTFIQLIWFFAMFCDMLWFFNGMEEFKTVALATALVKFLSLVLVFTMIRNQGDTLLYFIIMAVSQACSFIIVLPMLRKYITFVGIKSLNMKRHLIPTLKIALPQIVSYIYFQMDKVLLEQITQSTSIVAFYDQADKIVQVPVVAITAISAVMMPRAANSYSVNKDVKSLNELIKTNVNLSFLIMIPMMLGLMTIANDFVPWYLGKEYLSVGMIIVFMSPIIIARALSCISSNLYFIVINETKQMTVSYSISAILNVIIDIILIPSMGSYGAVIGTLVAEFMVVIVQYYYMLKRIKLDGSLKNMLYYFVLSFISCVAVYGVSIFIDASIIKTVIQIVVAVIIYLALLLITKDKNINILLDMIKNRKGETNENLSNRI